MLDRPYLVILATLVLMLAPFVAAPQIAGMTGGPLAGVVVALMLLMLPLLAALVRFDTPSFAEALRIFLCLSGAMMMLHWRPGQSVAEVLEFAKWSALPLSAVGLAGWGMLQARQGFRGGSGLGRQSFVVTVSLVLALAFLTFEPISERGYGVSLGFAVLAVAAHVLLMLQATTERRGALSRAQIWAVRLVEALGLADLLVLIAVLRPETPMLLWVIVVCVAALMFVMHAPVSRAFRR